MADASIAATLATLTELIKSQQEQIAQIQNQLQNQKTEIRQIPLIPKLTKAEDLQTWRDKLTWMLERYGLAKYIDKDIPEPEDPRARRERLINRLDVDDYIQATIPHNKVWNVLRGLGWSAKDTDPKKTFDFVIQYFKKGAMNTFFKLHQELAKTHCKDFDSLASFQTRISYLRERLEATDFKIGDRVYIWLALNGIASEYTDIHARCVARIDTMTWADLMAELQAQAVSESRHNGD